MEIENQDSRNLAKLIAHLETNGELKTLIQQIPKQDELFIFIKQLEERLQVDCKLKLFIQEMNKFLNINFLIDGQQPSIVYYTLILQQDTQIITNKLYKRYEETINTISKSKTAQNSITMACELIRKLRKMFAQNCTNFKTNQEFDNSFDKEMNEEERDMYDSILGEEQQPVISLKQNEPVKNDYIKIFNSSLTKLMEIRSRPDLKYKWLQSGFSIKEFYSYLLEQSKQQQNPQIIFKEFIIRMDIFSKLKNFYYNILNNFIDIPNPIPKFQQKINLAIDLKRKIEEIFLSFEVNQNTNQYDNEKISNMFMKVQSQIIYFTYKYLKLRKYNDASGKIFIKINCIYLERTYKVSLKRILENKLSELYKKHLDESYKKSSEKLNILEFCKMLYQKLRGSCKGVELNQFLYLLFEVKQTILKYYKLRACFIGVLDTIVAEIESADRVEFLVDMHFKYSMDIKQMLEFFVNKTIYFNWIVNNNLEETSMIQKRLNKDNSNTEIIREQIEIILNLTINRGLQILSMTEGSSRPQEMFTSFPNLEEKLYIKQKSMFSEIKEAQIFFKQISVIDQKQQQEQNQAPLEVFGWYNFIQKKITVLIDYTRQIKDYNLKLNVKNILDEYHWKNPKMIEQKLNQILENYNYNFKEDQVQVKKLLSKLKIEQKLSEYTYKYIELIIAQEKDRQFKEYITKCLEQFKIFYQIQKQHNQINDQPEAAIEQFYFYPPILYLHYYMLSDESKKHFLFCLEQLERYRYFIQIVLVTIYTQPNSREYESMLKEILDIFMQGVGSTENIFMKLNTPLETQFKLAQNFFNYSFQNYSILRSLQRQIQKQPYFDWKDQFPTIRLPIEQKQKPQIANDKSYNLCCYLTLLILIQKNENKFLNEIENIGREIEILSKKNYKVDDFKALQSWIDQITQWKYYGDTVNLKQKLINDSEKFNNEDYQINLYRTFTKYFLKNTIIELSIKDKKNLKLPLNKEEIIYELSIFLERKKQQIQIQLNSPDKAEKLKNIQEQTKLLTDLLKPIQKDYNDFILEISLIQERNNILHPQIKDYLNEYLNPYRYLLPQTVVPMMPTPHKPYAARVYINEQVIERKIQRTSKQIDYDRSLRDAFADKFKVFMEDFLIYTATDEFKVYHAGKKGKLGQKSLLDNDPKQEAMRKQLSQLYQVYGPTKECDINTTLLISQDEIQQKQTEYSLQDLTHQCSQPNFQKNLLNTDKKKEELMKNTLLSGRWRSERPELNDILSKKIKRGTDLGEALQNYYKMRLSDEGKQYDNENASQQQLDKIRYDDQDMIRNIMSQISKFRDDKESQTQMENKLKNLVNNEFIKKREIKQAVVQMVLEDQPFFKKSKCLMKSYLFVLDIQRKKD